jgi:hypothetical protein
MSWVDALESGLGSLFGDLGSGLESLGSTAGGWLSDLEKLLGFGGSSSGGVGFGGSSSGGALNLPSLSSISGLGATSGLPSNLLPTPPSSTGISGLGSVPPFLIAPSIAQQFGLPGPLSFLAGLGLLGYGGYQGYNALQQQLAAMNFAQDPAAMMQRIRAFEQPLSHNLIHSIMRDINPSIAARGLATSPGMTQQITAEALAPYELQEQQLATGLTTQGLQYPFMLGQGAAQWLPNTLGTLSGVFMPQTYANPVEQILLAMQLQQLAQSGAGGLPSGVTP